MFAIIHRGDIVIALRQIYFGEAEDNAKDFEGWKPDEVHEVNAKTWESVDTSIVFLLYW